jgi:hypothetical protein
MTASTEQLAFVILSHLLGFCIHYQYIDLGKTNKALAIN